MGVWRGLMRVGRNEAKSQQSIDKMKILSVTLVSGEHMRQVK